MSKGITDADNYICTLSDETRKIAETELRETNSSREHALAALREWVATNPRITTMRLGKFSFN